MKYCEHGAFITNISTSKFRRIRISTLRKIFPMFIHNFVFSPVSRLFVFNKSS